MIISFDNNLCGENGSSAAAPGIGYRSYLGFGKHFSFLIECVKHPTSSPPVLSTLQNDLNTGFDIDSDVG
jgi:hypothetical protein